MSTIPGHIMGDSIVVPPFSGKTTEFKKWQSSIRDFAVRLDLEHLLLQEIRFPGAAAANQVGDNRPFHRVLIKPPFPLDSATDGQIEFYEIKSRAFKYERDHPCQMYQVNMI